MPETASYTSPERMLLDRLSSAPKSVQPILMEIATKSEASKDPSGFLKLSVHYEVIQAALVKHQQAGRRDLAIAASVLATFALITASVVILLRG
jgi:hypothetical protein